MKLKKLKFKGNNMTWQKFDEFIQINECHYKDVKIRKIKV